MRGTTTDTLRATVHVGPLGGMEYRLWTGENTFRIVGKFKALPYMDEATKHYAMRLETERKAATARKAGADQAWRDVLRGG